MEQQSLKTTVGRRPPLAAFSIIEKEGLERPVWHKVGVAWVNRDGSINVQFDSLPLGGKVQLREERERSPQQGDAKGEAALPVATAQPRQGKAAP